MGATNPPPLTGELQWICQWAGHEPSDWECGVEHGGGDQQSVGIYLITVSQGTVSVADTNYSLAFVEGALTVTQAILSVTADDQVRAYGAANPELTGTVVGIQNEDAVVASYGTMARDQQPGGQLRDTAGALGRRAE